MEPYPKYIQIETTIMCNAKCAFCLHHLVTRRPVYMDESVFTKIVNETRGRNITYRPFLINEPFLDKRLPDFVRYIKEDSTARVELNTNAEVLTPEKSDAIIDAGLDLIKFSIDGFSQQTAGEARKVDYEKVRANTEYFLKRVRETGARLTIQVRMIDQPENEHEQDDYISFWSELGADTKITPRYTWAWDGDVQMVANPCEKVVEEMFFYVDGRATLCCWDANERAIIGDVHENKVSEIWTSEINHRYREWLAVGKREKIELCSKCNAYA